MLRHTKQKQTNAGDFHPGSTALAPQKLGEQLLTLLPQFRRSCILELSAWQSEEQPLLLSTRKRYLKTFFPPTSTLSAFEVSLERAIHGVTVTQFHSMSMLTGFRRHLLGKTLRNVCYSDVT